MPQKAVTTLELVKEAARDPKRTLAILIQNAQREPM